MTDVSSDVIAGATEQVRTETENEYFYAEDDQLALVLDFEEFLVSNYCDLQLQTSVDILVFGLSIFSIVAFSGSQPATSDGRRKEMSQS